VIQIELDEREVKVIKSGLKTRRDDVVDIRGLDKTGGLIFVSCTEELEVIRKLFNKLANLKMV